ncbi:hypothetical protein llg_27770 [Luteolibacter sp. LG18]|nr:hypothetical protein llg_27770 [Luteolibacter sp. LG18]
MAPTIYDKSSGSGPWEHPPTAVPKHRSSQWAGLPTGWSHITGDNPTVPLLLTMKPKLLLSRHAMACTDCPASAAIGRHFFNRLAGPLRSTANPPPRCTI